MPPISRLSLAAGLAAALACGDDGTTGGSAQASSGGDTTGTGGPTTGTSGAPTTSATTGSATGSATDSPTSGTSDTGGATTSPAAPELALPQAVAGAMMADQVAYPSLPIHVAVGGSADAVTVRVDDGPEVAAAPGAGTRVAAISIKDMSPGTHTITAAATGPGGDAEASAELVLGTAGAQWTDVTVDGNAGTPTLHRRPGEDRLWLSWADGSGGPQRRGWLEPIDGAGRSLGDRIALTPAGEDAPYARAALGQTAVGVLYQKPGGGPYYNRLRVVDLAGAELVAPIDLEPPGGFGSFGGDILYDGAAFVATFRSNDGMGGGDVWWIRVDEAAGTVTGPVKVASSGDGDPDGGFDPFSFVSLAAVDDAGAALTFVRERYNQGLGLALPKGQLAAVTAAGAVDGPDFIASSSDFQWHWESRVERAGDRLLLLWLTDDLNDPNTTIPTAIRGALVAADGAVGNDEGQGTILVQAPETRGEPAFVATDEAPGILVWTDQRTYVDLMTGRIELMATRVVDDSLKIDVEDVIPHARFVAGTANLGGAAAGTNAVITWIDERHGMGIVDPKPEVYIDTVWR